MKSIRSVAALVALTALTVLALPHAAPAASTPFDSAGSGLLAQGGPFDSAGSGLLAQGGLSQLRGIEELKSWFNTFKGHPRLVFLVSPT